MLPLINTGPVPSIETGPAPSGSHVERLAAKQNVLDKGSLDDVGEQRLASPADLIEAVNALPPVARQAVVAALAGAMAVERQASLSLKEAGFIAGRSPGTIALWARRHGIGHRVGGRYAIDAARLVAFISGGES